MFNPARHSQNGNGKLSERRHDGVTEEPFAAKRPRSRETASELSVVRSIPTSATAVARQTIAIAKAELVLLNSKLIRNNGQGNFFREIEFHQNDGM